MRLSEMQRKFLGEVAAAETPLTDFPEGLPLYVEHSTALRFAFDTEAERDRWIRKLETRGLITARGGCFVRLTDAGRAAIAD